MGHQNMNVVCDQISQERSKTEYKGEIFAWFRDGIMSDIERIYKKTQKRHRFTARGVSDI